MQKLTFKSYLSNYVRYLSGLETNSIKKLAKEAQTNFRMREPLLLFAYSSGKVNLLLEATKESELGKEYCRVCASLDFPRLLYALETKSNVLNERYHKCYHSYVCKRDMAKTYDRKKKLMREKIKNLQKQKGITTYRMCTDLGLNKSNVNVFIKHGDCSKVSLEAARTMLAYLDVRNLSVWVMGA